MFSKLAREMRLVARPVAKRRSKAVNSCALAEHASQKFQHRHVRERTPVATAEHELAIAWVREDRQRAVGQRDLVLTCGLHPFGRNCPYFLRVVDLSRAGANDFARARGR
jgi:hypothetical protein